MNDIDDIKSILNQKIDTKKQLRKLTKIYEKDLKDFVYIDDITTLVGLKNIYIRHININGKIGWGGFLFKIENNNNDYLIYLINKNKKPWSIDFNKNYIFYKKVSKNDDENIRDLFINFLDSQKK